MALLGTGWLACLLAWPFVYLLASSQVRRQPHSQLALPPVNRRVADAGILVFTYILGISQLSIFSPSGRVYATLCPPSSPWPKCARHAKHRGNTHCTCCCCEAAGPSRTALPASSTIH
ncbi:hypothetical protein LZ31DRAFT_559019 [Colletotrichum somersetense]|nr:hypothetical protein LZ31DRAFT_559019 [Colletotrichum somersetense]